MREKLDILFEDNHLIIVNKTCHDLVQGDKTGDKSLDSVVKDYIRVKYKKPGEVFLGVVHRLDRPVSGLVIFTRTSKALSRLSEMFRLGEVKKTYWALIKDIPPENEGTLVHYIKKNEKQNKSFSYDKEVKESKRAELDYQILGRSKSFYLLEINLKTGRHHQIRSQLSKIGCPIKGDLKYGFARSNADGGISLHARKLEFLHPVTKEMVRIIAKTPKEEPLWKEIDV